MAQQIRKQYRNEFLALLQAGATEQEALQQVAQSNEVSAEQVLA